METRNPGSEMEAPDESTSSPARRDLLGRHQSALLELAKFEAKVDDLDLAMRIITEVAARTLSVERAGVWVFDEERSKITCLNLFEQATGEHSRGQEVFARDAPNYFLALEQNRALAAHDAWDDFRTQELRDSYLVPQGIVSMLDAPIRQSGHIIGVVCHEHVGTPRHWSMEEQNFAGSIADMAALAIEHYERVRAEEELRRRDSLLDGVARAANRMFAEAEDELAYRDKLVRALADAAEALASGEHLDAQLESALRSLISPLRLDRAAIYFGASEGSFPPIAAVEEPTAAGAEPGAGIAWNRERLAGAATRREVLAVGADELGGAGTARGGRPTILAPLVDAGARLAGCVELRASEQDREWTSFERELARALAGVVASTLTRS